MTFGMILEKLCIVDIFAECFSRGIFANIRK